VSPANLGRTVSKTYQTPDHIFLFEEMAYALAGREVRFLIVEVPPRHGKSDYWSRLFPAWYLGTFPTQKVILTSYEAGLARSWGRRVRDLLVGYGPLFGVEVRTDVFAQDEWELTAGGGMITAGVQGSITGRGGNVLIVDDPLKNAEEALSANTRQKIWEWFQSTAFTRVEPGGVVVLIQTRWHEDDLVGRAVKESGLPWKRVRLPALAELDDPLNRAVGQPLWPERYDVEAFREIKELAGSYWWSALYQQNPLPQGETVFQAPHFSRYELKNNILMLYRKGHLGPELVPLSRCVRFATMDLAISMKTTADYTAMGVFALTPNRDLVLLHVYRKRMEGPDQVKLIALAKEKYQLAFIGVESVAYQASLVQQARREGLPIKALKPDTDKLSRALTAAAIMEGGKYFLPRYASWLGDYEAELLSFPSGKHDDQVDFTSYAAILAGQRAFQGTFT